MLIATCEPARWDSSDAYAGPEQRVYCRFGPRPHKGGPHPVIFFTISVAIGSQFAGTALVMGIGGYRAAPSSE